MKIKIFNNSILKFKGDILIVNLFEGVKNPGGATGVIDRALDGVISKAIRDGKITGKLGETFLINSLGRLDVNQIMVVGLGKSEQFGRIEIRKAAGAAALQARKAKAKSVGTIVHGAGIGGVEPELAAQAVIEGTLLGLYRFTEFKSTSEDEIKEFYIIEIDREKIKHFEKGIKSGKILAESQNIARDLTNLPANELVPKKLDLRLQTIIRDLNLTRDIRYRVLTKKEIIRMGMGALLSVAQGSCNEPRFIILRYKSIDRPLVCMIGKTVTFDSGGISLKPGEGMARMKGDMSGGAVVAAITLALARARAKVNLISILPAVENLPSGSASRPGDVVRALDGKTIEIISTDAEGRMTLADAIVFAEQEGAKVIVDIATLTGGCQATFGEVTAAVMGNDQRLLNLLTQVSKETGEKMWPMPLFEEYEEKLKSDIADIKNSGGRDASTITAGLFLKSFVKKSRWIHIDIAGKEFVEKENFYQPKGATGFGVLTLFEFIQRIV